VCRVFHSYTQRMTFPYWVCAPAASDDERHTARRLVLVPDAADRPISGRRCDESDVTLLDRVRAKDTNALTELFDAYMPAMVVFVAGIVGGDDAARDVVQDTFVSLWNGTLSGMPRTSVRAFLFAAARGRALHVLRRARTEARHAGRIAADETVGSMTSLVPRPDHNAEHDELVHAIRDAMRQLSPRVRQVAELRWYGAMSYAEISHVLGISERTVNNQLTTAVKAMRRILAPYQNATGI
jgi:RNA polymerase sigma factor (sigma-70 family)